MLVLVKGRLKYLTSGVDLTRPNTLKRTYWPATGSLHLLSIYCHYLQHVYDIVYGTAENGGRGFHSREVLNVTLFSDSLLSISDEGLTVQGLSKALYTKICSVFLRCHFKNQKSIKKKKILNVVNHWEHWLFCTAQFEMHPDNEQIENNCLFFSFSLRSQTWSYNFCQHPYHWLFKVNP